VYDDLFGAGQDGFDGAAGGAEPGQRVLELRNDRSGQRSLGNMGQGVCG